MADVTKHNKAVNTHKSRIAFFMVFFSFQLVFRWEHRPWPLTVRMPSRVVAVM